VSAVSISSSIPTRTNYNVPLGAWRGGRLHREAEELAISMLDRGKYSSDSILGICASLDITMTHLSADTVPGSTA